MHLVLSDLLADDDLSKFSTWILAGLDMIESKIYKVPKSLPPKKIPENACFVTFCNKGVEMVNLPRLFHDPILEDFLPSSCIKFDVPMVIYKLKQNIGTKIFNYNKFVENFDVDNFLKNEDTLPCTCKDSQFADSHHGHIITGDLKIVENNSLRKLFSKGPKYREPVKIDWDKVETELVQGVEGCVEKWCDKNAIHQDSMTGWLRKIRELFKDKIEDLKSKTKIHHVKEVLKEAGAKECLKTLQEKYVIVPLDKATGNFSFVCKRFYAKVLVDELGLVGSGSQTYKECIEQIPDVIKRNIGDLSSLFGINNIAKEHHKLPHMYWLPKKHKNPTKFRFIVAGPACSIKPLAKVVTRIFKMFYRQIDTYNRKARFFSGVNTFWVIQNNRPVTDAIKNINNRKAAKSITTFDFSTLYTKIPHPKLIDALNSLTNFCFKGGLSSKIAVNNQYAQWVNDNAGNKIVFDISSVKNAIKYLLDNTFFTVGNKLFQQVIGIPMGSDPAPFFANLFLYFYESKYVKSLMKRDLSRARRFGNTFRFIDDLNAINDGGEFERCYRDIYPEEMELGKENNSNQEATFLDLNISISNKKFLVGLYDKRNFFPFSIVRMPYADSNMPSKIFYSALGAEVLRIARATNNNDSFSVSCKTLLNRMLNQGGDMSKIILSLKKMFGRHSLAFKEITPNFHEFLSLIKPD